jgi:methylated-DNA-[protein]-cysteine S-methyltransferase
MTSHYDAILAAPFGRVDVRTAGEAVSAIVYLPERFATIAPSSPVARLLADQLDAYYANPDAPLDVPLAIAGTAFQRRVWDAIRAVPRGAMATYGTLAKVAGGTPRAVGQACGDNCFPLVIPCHRVVGAKGIGGFAHHGEDGFYLDVKRWLLRHEGAMLI